TRHAPLDSVVGAAPLGRSARPSPFCLRVHTSHSRSMLAWCRKKIGSTGDRKLVMLPYGPGSTAPTPPMQLCTLLCGMPSRIEKLPAGELCEGVFELVKLCSTFAS